MVGYRSVQTPVDAQWFVAGHAAQRDGLQHGRSDASASGVTLSLHRMWCQYRYGVGQCRRAHGPVHAWHVVLLRIYRSALAYAAGDGRGGLQTGAFRVGGGRGWLFHDAHHRARTSAVRRGTGRLWTERRDAAPGKRLPAAPGGSRRSGRELGEVPAPHRTWRQALRDQGRGHPLHRPDARWPAPAIQQHPGVQERGHHAVGRSGTAAEGLLQHHRSGMVRARQGTPRRCLG